MPLVSPSPQCSNARTAPVGSYPPNALGLYDLHGNVQEWCADWYGAYPGEPLKDPGGPSTGTGRVIRGGGWDCTASIAARPSAAGATPATGAANWASGSFPSPDEAPDSLRSPGAEVVPPLRDALMTSRPCEV